MPDLVVNGAQMTCTFGVAPSTLTVVPSGPILQAGGQLLARIVDMVPMMNVAPFGMCTTPSNPQVAAATSAAPPIEFVDVAASCESLGQTSTRMSW